jgi:DNA-binding response OmpR family regulator
METSSSKTRDASARQGAEAGQQPDLARASPSKNGIDLDVYLDVPARQRVLIVDDDSDTVTLLKLTLQNAGMDVIGALDGYEAVRKCSDAQPDVVLLDLMMPDMDGFETLRMIRQMQDVPIVIVSAKATKEDIVKGLNAGCDDYIPKPIHLDEVVARVKAVLRRAKTVKSASLLVFPKVDLAIDFEAREVTMKDTPIQFTPKPFAVLEVLARNAPRPVSHERIADEVWGEDSPQVRKRIKHTILLIRRNLGDHHDKPRLIINRPAFGYQLRTEPDAVDDA